MFSFKYFLKKFFPGRYFPPVTAGDQPTGKFPKYFYPEALYAFDYQEARYSAFGKSALYYSSLSLDAMFSGAFSKVARYANHALDALDKTLKFNRHARHGHLHVDSKFSAFGISAQYQIAKNTDACYSAVNKVAIYD